jgi:hypothetical protein
MDIEVNAPATTAGGLASDTNSQHFLEKSARKGNWTHFTSLNSFQFHSFSQTGVNSSRVIKKKKAKGQHFQNRRV